MKNGPAPHRADHYSYELYADPAMAESFDSRRFGGPIGQLIAHEQQDVLQSFVGNVAGQRVLDVGTGTGRAAIALARRGALVTGVDSSDEMLAVARRRADEARVNVEFVRGDAHGLSVPDRSYEFVICLRVLMHTPDWRVSLAELCRVAQRGVVFDYPALISAAALQSAVRHLAQMTGATTEAYRVFSDRSVRAALQRNGFAITQSHRQFVLPIALHKAVGSPAVTNAVERTLRRAGLNRLLGSPVTVLADRCAS